MASPAAPQSKPQDAGNTNGTAEPIVTPPGKPPKGAAEPAPGETQYHAFCIQISGPRNENVVCPFDRQKARGKWSKDGYGTAEPGEAVRKMPTIPGICFLVNTAQRTIRRFDPLGQPANANLLKKISRIMGIMQEADGLQAKPEDTKVWTECTDEELKNFTFWCRKMFDLKLCEMVKPEGGEPPTFKEIQLMPGDFRIGSFDQGAGAGTSIKSADFRYRPPARTGKDAFEYEPDSEPVVGIGNMGLDGEPDDDDD